MKFVAIIMVFLGYVLVYAGVANGGKFATQPWMGILQDAYATGSSAASSGGSGGSGSSSSGSATPNLPSTHVSGGGASSSSGSAADKQTPTKGSSLGSRIVKDFFWPFY